MKKGTIKKKTSSQTACYKFLTRNIKANVSEVTLQKLRIKRLYIRKIKNSIDGFERNLVSIVQKKYFSQKAFKYLSQIALRSLNQIRLFFDFPNTKLVKKFEVDHGYDWFEDRHTYSHITLLLRCLGKLPKQIETVNIVAVVDLLVKKGHIQKLYHILSTFRKLKSYTRDIDFIYPQSPFKLEYELMNKYFARLQNLKEVKYYDINWNYQKGFQKAMLQEKPCKWITNLKIDLREQMLINPDGIEDLIREELSQESLTTDEDEEDLRVANDERNELPREPRPASDPGRLEHVPETTIRRDNNVETDDSEAGGEIVILGDINGQNRELSEDSISEEDLRDIFNRRREQNEEIFENDIKPIFNFHLFPNLISLSLEIIEEEYFVVDSFVVESFAALKNLKHLKIEFMSRPNGTKFFFQGLLKLPLLEAFHLHVALIRDKEWKLLAKFLTKQQNLTSLALITYGWEDFRAKYLEQTQQLENTIKCLKSMNQLQRLQLRLEYFPLDCFSKALEGITNINNLKSIDVDGLISPLDSCPVEGFCNFIKMQKSLSTFKFQLPFVIDENTMASIAQALSGLHHLRKLGLFLNHSLLYGKKHFIDFCERMFQVECPVKIVEGNKTWHTFAAKMLKNLVNLESITISVRSTGTWSSKQQKGLTDLFKVLPTLKKLRKLEFSIPFSKLSEELRSTLASSLSKLKNVRYVFLWPSLLFHDQFHGTFAEVVAQVNLRQAKRTDLLF